MRKKWRAVGGRVGCTKERRGRGRQGEDGVGRRRGWVVVVGGGEKRNYFGTG